MRDPLKLAMQLCTSAKQFHAFQALRLIEAAHPHHAHLGGSARAAHEPIRLGHDAGLCFSAGQVSSYERISVTGHARLALDFGLLGADGAMPLHLTEYVRARSRHQGDRTIERFLDVFHHRMSSLLYRAWAESQPVVGLDRPEEDRFAAYVGSLCGLAREGYGTPEGQGGSPERAAIGDRAQLGAAAALADRRRHASGLAALLSRELGVPVRIEPFVGQWLPLPQTACVRFGQRDRTTLGSGYVLGRRRWDRQHTFRIVVGPLDGAQSERLQPGTPAFCRIAAWVRLYVGPTLEFEVALRLAHDAAPAMRLDAQTRLARNTWIGSTRKAGDEPVLRFRGDSQIVSTTE
jgi:type VI secretion system protein ImpH